MRRSTHPILIACSTVVTALAVVVLPTPSASAAVAITDGQFAVNRFVNDDGPDTCTVTNDSNASPVTAFTSNGTTASAAVNGSSTITNDGDGADSSVLTNSASAKVRAIQKGGRLRAVRADLTTSTKLIANQGLATDCDPEAQESLQLVFSVNLPATQWATITLSGAQRIVTAQLLMSRISPPTEGIQMLLGAGGKFDNTARVLLPAGVYTFQVQVTHLFMAPQSAAEPSAQSGVISLDVALADAGGAIAQAQGSGKKYVALGKAVKCSGDKLVSAMTKAAGIGPTAKVKKVTFFVNGKKKKSVNLPTRGDKITLTKMPAKDTMVVKVVVNLFGGGSATATRSYLSCR
jgi:hypothetical protein